MGPDDLLCSRNARSQTPLVGRAQWKINQPPSPKDNERGWRLEAIEEGSESLEGGGLRLMIMRRSRQTVLLARRAPTIKRWSLDARSKEQSAYSFKGPRPERWISPHPRRITSEVGGWRQKEGRVAWPSSCSRNAHDQNVLVRRAQSRIDQATL